MTIFTIPPSRQIRILLVIGNIQNYHRARIHELQKAARATGHTLDVATSQGVSRFYLHSDSADRMDMSPPAVNYHDRAIVEPRSLKDCWRTYQMLAAYHPTVVVTMGYQSLASLTALFYAHLHRSVYCIFLSDSKADDGKRSFAKELLKRMVVPSFAGAVVPSYKHAAYLATLGMPSHRVVTGYDTVDVLQLRKRARFARRHSDSTRRRLALPDKYVLVVARLVPRKRVLDAITAFVRSDLIRTGFRLLIVGTGPEMENCKAFTRKLDRENFATFCGAIEFRRMPYYYAMASCTMLLSEYDQWGLCINESLACETPVIVSRACGCADTLVLNAINGYVVEVGDVNATAAHLNRLCLSNPDAIPLEPTSTRLVNSFHNSRFAEAILTAASHAVSSQ